MPATGDRITKRKDGLFQGVYTALTPEGPKRKYVYGRRKKDVGATRRGAPRSTRARSPSGSGSTRGSPTVSSRSWTPAR